jgi:hypothetical protein
MSMLDVLSGKGYTPPVSQEPQAEDPEVTFDPPEEDLGQEQEAQQYPSDLAEWLSKGNTDIEAFYASKFRAAPTPALVAPQTVQVDPFEQRLGQLQENLALTRDNLRTAESMGATEMVATLRAEENKTIAAIAYESGTNAARQQQSIALAQERVTTTFDSEYEARLLADFGLQSKGSRRLMSIPELPLSSDLILQLDQSPALRLMAIKVAAYDELVSRSGKKPQAPRMPQGASPSQGTRQQAAPVQSRIADVDFLRNGFGKKEGK